MMTIQEFNDFAAANGLGPDTEITVSDFSGTGTLKDHNLGVEGVDDQYVTGRARTLNIDASG